MKKIIVGLVLASMVFVSAAWAADQELKIFIWSEYMDEVNMPKAFEQATGIKVKLDLYESNEEMLAKLQAGGVSEYDIVVPSDYIMPSLIHLGLLQPLDHSKIPNLKNLSDKFKNPSFDPGNKYSAGWQWGTVGLMYRKDRMTDAQAQSWGVLFDPKQDRGPFCLLDSVREMMGISLKYLGYDFNSIDPKQLKEAADLLIKTKKRGSCLGFKGGVGGKNDVVAGLAAAAIVYNGDAIQAMAEDPTKLGFIVPKEGGEIWVDSMCIPAKAPNPDAAHKWINWVLEPKVGASLSNYNHYASPNGAAKPYLNKEDLANPGVWPTPEIMETLEFVKDLGNDNRIVDEAWTAVKSH
jgi:spermidine/putrescine transport system substrate-binding protein